MEEKVMGVVAKVRFDSFPRQSSLKEERVKVCFNYDTENFIFGKIVRDDAGTPFITIIALDDGRYVLATECQFSFVLD